MSTSQQPSAGIDTEVVRRVSVVAVLTALLIFVAGVAWAKWLP
jgi:small-conductance mechanosensitive channel